MGTSRTWLRYCGQLLLLWSAMALLYGSARWCIGFSLIATPMRLAVIVEALFLTIFLCLCRENIRLRVCRLGAGMAVGGAIGLPLGIMLFAKKVDGSFEEDAWCALFGGVIGSAIAFVRWIRVDPEGVEGVAGVEAQRSPQPECSEMRPSRSPL